MTGLSSPVSADEIRFRIKTSPRDSVEVTGLDTAGVPYICLNELADVLRFPSAVNDTVKKFEFRISTRRIKFSRNNPFLVVTDVPTNASSVYQLPQPVLQRDRKYYAPLFPFVSFFDRMWAGGVSLDSLSLTMSLGSFDDAPEFDITGVSIERKSNGYLIIIHALRKFGEVEAWLKPDGWLFVTIANAKADTFALSRTRLFGAIRNLLTFQSPTSVQLTFKVAPDVAQAEVINEPESHDLLIALRTLSPPEKEAIEKKRQQSIQENLEKERNRWKLDVIVIDAGHGGKDPGALGVAKTKEKDITLGVALKLGKFLEKNLKGVKVVYTRKTDAFIELYRRTQIANEAGGKLFVSIHCNSLERKPSRARGFEIYLLRPGKTEEAIEIAERENSVIQLEEGYEQRYQKLTEENFILVTMAQSAYVKYSEHFAEIAAEAMEKNSTLKNSGVKQAGFYVLVGASMPNVLVETGYLSNRTEEKFLKSSAGQTKIAEALYNGIKQYKEIYEKALSEGSRQ
ncbi:MAG: N-acetylmuramoyl-L-alanine amidase [Ignavibacteriales bacterium]|nr:N-acetylmuramoyl-L-alanine amidase [Ignavibacteriales bacterium]